MVESHVTLQLSGQLVWGGTSVLTIHLKSILVLRSSLEMCCIRKSMFEENISSQN